MFIFRALKYIILKTVVVVFAVAFSIATAADDDVMTKRHANCLIKLNVKVNVVHQHFVVFVTRFIHEMKYTQFLFLLYFSLYSYTISNYQ